MTAEPVPNLLPLTAYLESIRNDTSIILDVLHRGSAFPVPTCPGWDTLRLAGHISRVHRMATLVASTGLLDRPKASDLLEPPADSTEMFAYITTGLADLLATLEQTPSDSPAWNMIGAPPISSFWPRRMAHETFVHRVDAELSAGLPISATSVALSIDGVNEFFDMFKARVLPNHPDASLGGSLHLHASDGDGEHKGEWMIRIEEGFLTLEHGHGKGDAAIRGTAASLLLGLWGRSDFASGQFQQFGDPAVVARFAAFGAF
jgi:uncharacterized protein (TIGR03083 family)